MGFYFPFSVLVNNQFQKRYNIRPRKLVFNSILSFLGENDEEYVKKK
jgi:hypothetical protein